MDDGKIIMIGCLVDAAGRLRDTRVYLAGDKFKAEIKAIEDAIAAAIMAISNTLTEEPGKEDD